MGESTLSRHAIIMALVDVMKEWPANSYHPIARNCVTFSETLCNALGAPMQFPGWVRGVTELGSPTCYSRWPTTLGLGSNGSTRSGGSHTRSSRRIPPTASMCRGLRKLCWWASRREVHRPVLHRPCCSGSAHCVLTMASSQCFSNCGRCKGSSAFALPLRKRVWFFFWFYNEARAGAIPADFPRDESRDPCRESCWEALLLVGRPDATACKTNPLRRSSVARARRQSRLHP